MPRPRSRRTYRRGLIDGTPSHVSGSRYRAAPGPQRADVRCPVCSAGPRWPCEELNKKRRKFFPIDRIHPERAQLDREHKRARRAAKRAAERTTP